ncbi:hypothetical protein IHE45_16G073300 [Dioscorea alata]|uniref:Uncharacterized protein n=1 Tax=Dioscorea alata TaxID=55571 RepID=A0ACB7UI73_DIOAL|nr:hypothetical protein IHE45_16G073300 [Dioscorea alata]
MRDCFRNKINVKGLIENVAISLPVQNPKLGSRDGKYFSGKAWKWTMARIGDVVLKTFTAGAGVCTLYLLTVFSYNVYQGLSWHSAQSKIEKKESSE